MTLPLVLLIVGLAAVAAAWHVALRALGLREDRSYAERVLEEMKHAYVPLERLTQQSDKHEQSLTDVEARLSLAEKRVEQLSAHAAFATGRGQRRAM